YFMREPGTLTFILYNNLNNISPYRSQPRIVDTQFLNHKFYSLFHLIRYNDKHTLIQQAKQILGSDLTDDEKFELLLSKHSERGHGLYQAFLYSYTELLAEYIPLILDSSLTKQQKVDLLSAKHSTDDEDGIIPGLYGVLKDEHLEIAEVYINLIVNTNQLEGQQIKELLQPKDSLGNSGLYFTFQNGDISIICFYTKTILSSSKLTSTDKVELLAAKNKSGDCGLYIAFQNGQANIVSSFTEQVINCDKLTEEEKLELLLAKNASGGYGLSAAFPHAPNHEVILQYTSIVLSSDKISDELKVKLLIARYSNGDTGLGLALELDLTEKVQGFVDQVLKSNLSDAHKVEILSPKDAVGHSALGNVLVSNSDINQATREFANLIAQSDLSFERKAKLLAANLTTDDGRCLPIIYIATLIENVDLLNKYISLVGSIDALNPQQKLTLILVAEYSSLYRAVEYEKSSIAIIIIAELLKLKFSIAVIHKYMCFNNYNGLLVAIDKDPNFLDNLNNFLKKNQLQAEELLKKLYSLANEYIKQDHSYDKSYVIEYLGYKDIETFKQQIIKALQKLESYIVIND
ncbi:MAG: hypothetical protein ACK4M7_02580, partial [Burkholderiales bacterium]